MSWTKWLPLRFILRRAARSQGFLDPIELMARLRSFAQPSEVSEPVELLRAGVVFHARGLINSKVIQHNLDWVWPYWIERQYDPHDEAFIPRAFSLSHINLTHRNWTAIGYPDGEALPLVDPRGLLTPDYDGPSLDAWVLLPADGRALLPSRAAACEQSQSMDPDLAIHTRTHQDGLSLHSTARVVLDSEGKPVCELDLEAASGVPAWLVVSLRPYNPEGISFVHELKLSEDRRHWTVDGGRRIEFSAPAERHHVSDYRAGDVYIHLRDQEDQPDGRCDLGMLTAAALFPIGQAEPTRLQVRIPLEQTRPLAPRAWPEIRSQACRLECPEPRYQFLYDAAVTSLILHSPDDVYPGPYTYKRFWFRDAAFIIHALLCLGLDARAERALERFPPRQTARGYFRSQEGEWDANGEVLWILQRYEQLTGKRLGAHWHNPIARGARWITRKRLPATPASPHAGLLPAGFSAEHLGPNDYYYWDDFWGVAGLNAAGELLAEADPEAARPSTEGARDFSAAIDRSLAGCAERLGRPAMPASPYRRLDAGAIGSLAVGYPLQQCAPDDPRLLDSVEFLLANCFVNGAFFQDMIHSGLNAYLTLHVAQILLRAGDPRYLELMDTVAELASPTGQWPEAIHPRTGGGCMGDGHHVWAAAEWVLMLRNAFVREEGETLILAGGVPGRWLEQDRPIRFGPAPTRFGRVSVQITPQGQAQVQLEWQAEWHTEPPPIEVRLPGFEPVQVQGDQHSLTLVRQEQDA
ncbi:hypothetical protein [Thiohalobacter thiocyanaticus]|uniref:Uncharacterized protein n=1 Tax=Thiohalobacter thiocyanaticus TaxID=585455 RepID=A0A426QLW8_9GAMM|nr:hypothetical protein [Thiohalobacter thiocyanaticus]RRQ22762.1 hypothetical protein D6C00_13045 [Thiohalobacter thiocyanaticus]